MYSVCAHMHKEEGRKSCSHFLKGPVMIPKADDKGNYGRNG